MGKGFQDFLTQTLNKDVDVVASEEVIEEEEEAVASVEETEVDEEETEVDEEEAEVAEVAEVVEEEEAQVVSALLRSSSSLTDLKEFSSREANKMPW